MKDIFALSPSAPSAVHEDNLTSVQSTDTFSLANSHLIFDHKKPRWVIQKYFQFLRNLSKLALQWISFPLSFIIFIRKVSILQCTSKFSYVECKNVTMITNPSSPGYNRWLSILGESRRTIMHHAYVVVRNPKRVDFRVTSLIEVMRPSYKELVVEEKANVFKTILNFIFLKTRVEILWRP